MENDENFRVEMTGEIDLTKSEANASGLFTAEGTGEMVLVLNTGDRQTRIKVHKLIFEGVLSEESGTENP